MHTARLEKLHNYLVIKSTIFFTKLQEKIVYHVFIGKIIVFYFEYKYLVNDKRRKEGTQKYFVKITKRS